ncbi:unnamed protein product [Lepidochelys kempii]
MEAEEQEENCQLDQEKMRITEGGNMMLMTFDEMALHFCEAEWGLLDEEQREIYKEVMQENYETLISLGFPIPKPEMIAQLERGEEPFLLDLQHSEEMEILMVDCTGNYGIVQEGPDEDIEQPRTLSGSRSKGNISQSPEERDTSDGQHICGEDRLTTCTDCGKSFSRSSYLADIRESTQRRDPSNALSVGKDSPTDQPATSTREPTPGSRPTAAKYAGKASASDRHPANT